MNTRMKASSINQYSPYADHSPDLSQIDSMHQNGEINDKEARDMAIKWAVDNDQVHLLATILSGK